MGHLLLVDPIHFRFFTKDSEGDHAHACHVPVEKKMSSTASSCLCPLHGEEPPSLGSTTLSFKPFYEDMPPSRGAKSSQQQQAVANDLVSRRTATLELNLKNKMATLGPQAEETITAWKKLVGEYNQEAMIALSHGVDSRFYLAAKLCSVRPYGKMFGIVETGENGHHLW